MFKDLSKGLLAGIVIHLLEKSQCLSIQLLKIESAKYYLHGVQMARSSAIGLMGLGLVIGLISVGVVLFHAGLFILLPWTLEAKAALVLVLGLAYVAIGSVTLHAAMKGKTWMEKSGAAEMLKNATGQTNKE